MDESLQQIIALSLVALVVGLELLRRARKKKAGKAGCDGCDTGSNGDANAAGETTLKFYKKNPPK
jgi:hypothetical protein